MACSVLEPGTQPGAKTIEAELHGLVASCLGCCDSLFTAPEMMPSQVEYAGQS